MVTHISLTWLHISSNHFMHKWAPIQWMTRWQKEVKRSALGYAWLTVLMTVMAGDSNFWLTDLHTVLAYRAKSPQVAQNCLINIQTSVFTLTMQCWHTKPGFFKAWYQTTKRVCHSLHEGWHAYFLCNAFGLQQSTCFMRWQMKRQHRH